MSASEERRLAAIMFTDMVGYSALSQRDAKLAQELLEEHRELLREILPRFHGTEIKTIGDAFLVEFSSALEAAQCAIEIQRALAKRNADVLSDRRIEVKIGIHIGDVVHRAGDVYGDGVNIASRIEQLAGAGGICVSMDVERQIRNSLETGFEKLAPTELKNISVPMDLFRIVLPWEAKASPWKSEARSEPDGHYSKSETGRRRILAISTAILLLLAGLLGYQSWRTRDSSVPRPASDELRRGKQSEAATGSIPEKSIAVLPLENLSDQKENAFFADGIQDELLSNLAKIKDLKVISRTSVMQYKTGFVRNLKEIAQQLGVSKVVEGSVRRSGNHVRVSVQLIDALADRHIWAQNYDRTLADSLALQGELATEIAAGVGATLSPQEKARVEATPTKNTAAYDAYLRGRAFAGGSPFDKSAVERAIQSYEEAVKLDPSFALAWARLSHVQSLSYWLGHDPSPARLAAAKDAADHALALDPNSPESHLALGYFRYYGQRDFAGALAEFQQAEQGVPNNVDVVIAIGLIQRRLGRWDEAIAELRRAVELDPRNIDPSDALALTYSAVRRFTEALASADRVLALQPANTNALTWKARVFWATGNLQAAEALLPNPGTEPRVRGVQVLFQRRYAAAIEILSNAVAADSKLLDPRSDERLFLGLSQQRAGDVAAARATYQKAAQDFQRQLDKVARDSFKEAELHAALGWAYAGLGEADSAVAEGQKAMGMRPTSKDPFEGPAQEENMARIYALLGDGDHAIPILQRLLQIPYAFAITPALLRLDPVWDQIRNDPRLQKLTHSDGK